MVAALDKARLRVATTACTYFYRFYSKYMFQDHDPRLIVPACIYLSGVEHVRVCDDVQSGCVARGRAQHTLLTSTFMQ